MADTFEEPAYNLKDVPFPECARTCAVLSYLGCGECESVCPWKFPEGEKE
jgi:ferredoxin